MGPAWSWLAGHKNPASDMRRRRAVMCGRGRGPRSQPDSRLCERQQPLLFKRSTLCDKGGSENTAPCRGLDSSTHHSPPLLRSPLCGVPAAPPALRLWPVLTLFLDVSPPRHWIGKPHHDVLLYNSPTAGFQQTVSDLKGGHAEVCYPDVVLLV